MGRFPIRNAELNTEIWINNTLKTTFVENKTVKRKAPDNALQISTWARKYSSFTKRICDTKPYNTSITSSGNLCS